jgi:hypothetical protein
VEVARMADAVITPALIEQARWRLEARGVRKTFNI